MIAMPPRNSVSEQVVRAASRCVRLACERQYCSVAIKDAATVVSGGTPDTSNPKYWDGGVVWVTPKDLGRPRSIEIAESERTISSYGVERSSAKLLPVGTVLLSSRAPIGHLGISTIPLSTNQGFKNITCGPSLHNRYLFHILRASIEELQALGRGNTFLEIPARAVQEFRIPLPPIETQKSIARFLDTEYRRQNGQDLALPVLPRELDEQRRIVARIEELAARIEQARGLRREVMAEGETLLPAFTESVMADLDAQLVPLGNILREDSLNGLGARPSDEPPGLPILRISAGTTRTDAVVDEGDFKFLPLDDAAVAKYKLHPGDLLACRFNGNLSNVGKFALYQGYSGVTHVYPDKLIRFRVNIQVANPAFVRIAMNSRQVRESIEAHCATTAGNIGISAGNLKSIPLPLPPLTVQDRIVAQAGRLYAHMNNLRKVQEVAKRELDALLPSVLDKAFRGEL